MTGRRRKRQTDGHFSPLEQVIKYCSNLDCIFIASSRQTHFEIACSAWVYSHIPASECFQGSHMTPLLIAQPPNPQCLRKWKLSRSLPWVISSLALQLPREWKSAKVRTASLPGKRWWFHWFRLYGVLYVLCGKHFCSPLQGGKNKTKLDSWQGFESHNLGRECSQRTSLPHCLESQ